MGVNTPMSLEASVWRELTSYHCNGCMYVYYNVTPKVLPTKCTEGGTNGCQCVSVSHQGSRHVSWLLKPTPALSCYRDMRALFSIFKWDLAFEVCFCLDIKGVSNYAEPPHGCSRGYPSPLSPSPWLLTLLWDLVSPLHMRLLSLACYTRGSLVCSFFVATLPTDPFIDPPTPTAAQMQIGVPSSEQASRSTSSSSSL